MASVMALCFSLFVLSVPVLELRSLPFFLFLLFSCCCPVPHWPAFVFPRMALPHSCGSCCFSHCLSVEESFSLMQLHIGTLEHWMHRKISIQRRRVKLKCMPFVAFVVNPAACTRHRWTHLSLRQKSAFACRVVRSFASLARGLSCCCTHGQKSRPLRTCFPL